MVGGTYSWLAWLLPALRDRGLDPRALVITPGDPVRCPTIDTLRARGIPTEAVGWMPCAEDRVEWILRHTASDIPDVMVVNLVVAAYHANPWFRVAGIPTIGVMHSDDPFYRGLREEFLVGPPNQRLNAIVGVSRFLAEDLARSAPSDVAVRAVPYGVKVPPKPASWSAAPFRFAYVGRLVEEQKRISAVARAFCRVVQEVPNTEGVFYGDGAARPQVEKILKEAGVGDRVRLAGRVDPDRIQNELVSSQVVVLLSDYEGLPIALLESMACGCVPVCRDIRSGIPELIQNDQTGLLIKDDEGLVDAIRKLRNGDALWNRLSTAARDKILGTYSAELCLDRWAELIRELAESHRDRKVSRMEVPARVRIRRRPHPSLAHEDARRPTLVQRVVRRIKRLATTPR